MDSLAIAQQQAQERQAKLAGFDNVSDWKADIAAKEQIRKDAEAAKWTAHLEKIRQIQIAREAAELAEANEHGFATYAEYKADQQRRRDEAVRKAQSAQLFSASGIPPRYVEALENGVTLTEEQERVRGLAAIILAAGGFAAIIGPRGTGKTHLAAVIGQEACEQQSVRYLKVLDYFRAVKDTFGRDAAVSESDVVKQHVAYGLLILDECHERSGSDWELTQLNDLLDRRYSSRRATLLISNQTRAALAENLGASICSRLREDGDVLELAGESYREVIRAERGKAH